ncbi:transcription elongation factor, putative [Theileria annulata]|uniref:Transcription elongation factor, putative n=1 Tax=Theileria annulata TaxID=5874 RepID=Q4UH96_THEAN|nr:transcription elongation factor, putative [Theileria annulata]CAI73543.1 transcription elongation factor, putative [Theileria annulata]|eukprot:XP_954220.1 transcription elongation factor, putative [Theileria annulata]
MNNILELKKRIDNIINSINNGNYNNSLEILLDELELINIDRNILQNTRIGSSLTKLSKSLLPIHKITSQRVISIINKWKSQLRNSVTVTGTTASNGPEVTTDNLSTTNSTTTTPNRANSTNTTVVPGPEDSSSKDIGTVGASTVTEGKGANFTAMECTGEKNPNEIAVVTKTGESSTFSEDTNSKDTEGVNTEVNNEGAPLGTNEAPLGTKGAPLEATGTHGLGEEVAVGPDTVTGNPKYMGPLRNNIYRDKALRYLFDSFIIGKDFEIEMEELTEKINLIEKSLYNYYIIEKNNQKGYNQQLKCIGFNLKDNKNTIFNYKLYNNIISINELIHMSSLQMASDEKKLQRNEILEQSLEACQSDWEIKNIFLNNKTKGQFKCNKCNSKITTYYQLQTRSSDEPMTTFVTCLNCNNRWKF